MNPLKKKMRALTIRNMILSFSIKILLKSCKYWKQLQKLFLLLWKTIVWTLCPLSKYHELPFKSTLQSSTSTSKSENKIYIHCFVKVNVSKKATQIDKIFTVYLTFTTWCQIIGEDFITLCGLLRKNELYPTSFNEWSLLFFSGRRVFCTQTMKNCCSLEFIHGVFLKKRAALYKIPIKSCVRNLIQCYSDD